MVKRHLHPTMNYTVEVRKDFGQIDETELAKFKENVNKCVWDLVKTMECLQMWSDNYPLLVQNTSVSLRKQKVDHWYFAP